MKNWYVVYTKPRWEKKVSKLLDERSINNYCPLNRVQRVWSDRRKTVHEPLFKGYVFVNIDEVDIWSIKNIEGILNYVFYLGKPAKVRQDEIDRVKKFLNEFENIEVEENKIKNNNSVLVKKGLLMDFKGIVIELVGNKAKVHIESMGINLTAIFDKNNLLPI